MHALRELFEVIRREANGDNRTGERNEHDKLLDALEWEDTDSGKELEERGHAAEQAKRELVG